MDLGDMASGDLGFTAPIASSTLPRWERKLQQSHNQSKTPSKRSSSILSKTPKSNRKKTKYTDRFIPNRESMNSNLNLHSMNNENERVGPKFCSVNHPYFSFTILVHRTHSYFYK